jgi:class 3 adenylate cyclase
MIELALSPERSIVTMLSVDTVDSTEHIAGIDPDDAQELLDKIFDYLSTRIAEAGGFFVSYAGDGGIAVFGWPNSYEDHADRACQAAWMIQATSAEAKQFPDFNGRPVRFRAGIHSGLVGLRRMNIGHETRLDTVGGAVHLTSTLQKTAAAGEIVISSQAVELCRSELDLSPHDSSALTRLKLKAYRLGKRSNPPLARARQNYSHPIVGRAVERRLLREVLTRSNCENSAVAIIGEPGIGKSRLTASTIEIATANAIPALVIYGDSQNSTTPYAAMRSLILTRLGLDDYARDDEIVATLNATGMDQAVAGALGTVVLVNYPEAKTKQTRTQVAREIIDAFERLTEGRAVLIVVEDLHLLDPESLYCLRLLSRETGPASRTLIVTGRPESLGDARNITDTVLQLEPLPRDDMEELARQHAQGRFLSKMALDAVLGRADGIPFVLEQIMLSIGSACLGDVDLLPQSVQSVIHARLNRLSADAKSLAQGLSVFGDRVTTEFVLRALGLEEKALERDRAELEHLEILGPGSANSTHFRHAIVSEACLATVPGSRRKELHWAAINAITSLHPDLDGQHERLALHAEGAGDDEAVLKYLWLALLRARRSSASGTLELIFKRAMRYLDKMGEAAEPQFVDFVLMAFDPLQQLGHFRSLEAHLPRAIELAQKQNRQGRISTALCHMAMVSWFEGRYSESLEQSEKALVIAADIGSVPLTVAAKFILASALHGMADMTRAIGIMRELCSMLSGELERARLGAAGIPGSIVRSYLCWFLVEVGGYEEGQSFVVRGLEIARQEKEPYSEMLARLGMGRNLIRLKRDHEAVECLEIAVTLVERNGYNAVSPHIIGLLSTALARSGRAEGAVQKVEAWLKSKQEERTGRLELYYLNAGYAEALFGLGRIDEAVAAIDRALVIGRAIKNPCLIVQGLGLRVRFRGSGGSVPDVERDLAERSELCSRYALVADV